MSPTDELQGPAIAFVNEALSNRQRAEEMLALHPEIAGAGPYPALVLGDRDRVESAVRADPKFPNAKGGPRDWAPLVYVCFSMFAARGSNRADALVETAELLLRHGADSNGFYLPEEWPDNPLPCLYGATGVNNNPALARALLAAGANPNDSESLYHSTENADLDCLRLLLEHGASPTGTNALKHMLDREEPEGLRLLLAAGANPNERNERAETALHWAVRRGRSAAIAGMLIDFGAELDARRKDGRTAYAMAVLSEQDDVAAMLKERGAETEIPVLDPSSPDDHWLLPDCAASHRTHAVLALLTAGIPVDARGELGGTALHWACWKGYADIATALVEHGASVTVEDSQYNGTPPGWLVHGLQNCRESRGNYASTAHVLLAAGAKFPSCDVPSGDAGVDAVLREFGALS